MLYHVHLQLIRPLASVVALLAGKRLLTSVRTHVTLCATGVTAREAALVACKGLFTSMCEHVGLEMLRLSEGIVALLTPERLLP